MKRIKHKGKFRCVAFKVGLHKAPRDWEQCRKLYGHAGAHRYTGEIEYPPLRVLPKEPKYGWSPYV